VVIGDGILAWLLGMALVYKATRATEVRDEELRKGVEFKRAPFPVRLFKVRRLVQPKCTHAEYFYMGVDAVNVKKIN
jgi:hypothetical protein